MKTSKDEETSSDSDEESETEEVAEPKAGPSPRGVKRSNPFFKPDTKNEEADSDDSDDISDSSEFNDTGDSDSDDDDDTGSSGEENEDGKDENVEGESNKLDEDEEEEDPLITALKKAKEKQERTCPPDIKFRNGDLIDISFHPSENLIVASHIDGEMSMFEFANDVNKLRKKFNIHKSTVRSVEFDLSGKFLISGSKDKSFKITDIETSQIVHKVVKAHSSALYKVKPLTVNLVATGDEDGTVKLWDNRMKTGDDGNVSWGSVMESKKFDEFVSDIYFDANVDDKIMVASSGEGTLLSFNLRGKRPDLQSEVYPGELNSLAIVHKSSKLVAGCADGRLYMFDWKQFGYHSADFPGHPDAINCVLAATENVVITACEDGSIRAVHLYPHRFIGTVGHHEGNFPIERLDISSTGELIASISHDQRIKFWSIKYLEEMEYNRRPKPFHQKKIKMRRKENKMQRAKEIEHQLPSSNRGNRRDFFKGLDDEDA